MVSSDEIEIKPLNPPSGMVFYFEYKYDGKIFVEKINIKEYKEWLNEQKKKLINQ